MKSFRTGLVFLIAACAMAVCSATTHANAPDVTSVDTPAIIGPNLMFKHGDDPAWAAPDLDTSDWQPVQLASDSFRKDYTTFGPYTWFRVEATLPPTTPGDLALLLPPIAHGCYEVFANGQRIGSFGGLPPDVVLKVPAHCVFAIPATAIASDGRLAIAIRFWHEPGLPDHWPHITLDDVQIGHQIVLQMAADLAVERRLNDHVSFLVLACLFAVVGLYNLQLFRRRRELKEYFWFGLMALSFAANTFMVSAWPRFVLDSQIVLQQITQVTIAVVFVSAIEFLWRFLGLSVGRFLRAIEWLQCALAVAACLDGNGAWLSGLASIQLGLTGLLLIPAVGLVVRETWRGRPQARTVLFGVIAMALCEIPSILNPLLSVRLPALAQYGFALLILAMSVALANRFSQVYADLDRLNRNLEGEVANRTKELLDAQNQLTRQSAELQAANVQLGDLVAQLKDSEQTALDASRAKSTFLANMSHELRTPLNAVLGFVQLMQREPGRAALDRERFAIITRSGEHLLSLINDVLSISKIEAGQTTLNEVVFDLTTFLLGIEEMFRLRALDKGLGFTVDVPDDLPRYVRGDEGKLRQVCINLLGNAFKFTDQGGVALRIRWDEGRAEFEVEDTGSGIEQSETSTLFEAFSQTQSGREAQEGSGLGLAISRSFVGLMGGSIDVRSSVGEGTIFRFDVRLPVAERDDASGEPSRIVGLDDGQPRFRILVVDDKAENRLLLCDLLSGMGFEVKESVDGQEAITAWDAWHPHAILMDIRMPVLDGLEATRRIRRLEATAEQSRPRTVVIALSASVFERDRKAVVSAGCDDFIPKPFREDVLLLKLEQRLGVRYRYATLGTEPDEPDEPHDRDDLIGRIAALPADLIAPLNEAIVEGDVETAGRAIANVHSRDERLAAELARLVRSYRFDDLQDMLARASTRDES